MSIQGKWGIKTYFYFTLRTVIENAEELWWNLSSTIFTLMYMYCLMMNPSYCPAEVIETFAVFISYVLLNALTSNTYIVSEEYA